MKALTVGQWLGIMQQDGPGSETVIEHRDAESLAKWNNARRADKGLPPLPLPSERAREREDVMTNEQIEKLGAGGIGARVSTPHGPGTVESREGTMDGWMVRRDRDGLMSFYHAWDLHPKVDREPEKAAKK